jgi:hypothetical protein
MYGSFWVENGSSTGWRLQPEVGATGASRARENEEQGHTRERGCEMQTVTGVFSSRADAEHAVETIRSLGVPGDKVTLLTPGKLTGEPQSVPVVAAEQPGMGKAMGAVVGGAAGLSGGSLLVAAMLPGVGLVTAAGLLGSAILGAAGASLGAAAGGTLEDSMTEGLPEDEIFVYEDALRKGRSVVMARVVDTAAASSLRDLMDAQGAEAVDAAREQWWIGLRGAEREHYVTSGRNFSDDEKLYRLGFEAALHARNRCREYDQVLAEMTSELEQLQRQYPNAKVEEPFTRGYERGREYYEGMCKKTKAA